MSGLIKSSIARKVVMALSGLFLVFFLGQHFVINVTSVIAPDTFNSWSHFMGYNPLVQYILQPILIAGVIIHFVMGIVLELQNRSAVLAFLGLHFYDFWVHEMAYKYIESNPEDPTRYHAETVHKFEPFWRTVIYVISFVLLAMHLLHGFASSFQSMGLNNKYTPAIKMFTKVYAIGIPLGFIFIALYHHFNQLTH